MYTFGNQLQYYSAIMLFHPLQAVAVSDQSAPSIAPLVVLVADDLTGACDSAAQFAHRGHRARLLLRGEHSSESVWAFSTGVRDVSAEAASTALKQRLRALPPECLRRSTFFQKIDSAGRGPIAANILTAEAIVQPDIILCAPAFPALGRVVRHGILHVRDIAGQDTSSHLASLFPDDVQPRIASIPTGAAADLQAAVLDAQARGKSLWLCDSGNDQDLRALVQAALRLSLRILWSGSGGLASALASEMLPAPISRSTVPKPLCVTSLLICGTPHPVTRLQIQNLYAQRNVSIFEVNWGITSVKEVRENFLRVRPESLILTGGDTAAFVLNALDCASVLIGGELAPGIPWGRISGGLADGCPVITKSGGFGDEGSLVAAADFCTRGGI